MLFYETRFNKRKWWHNRLLITRYLCRDKGNFRLQPIRSEKEHFENNVDWRAFLLYSCTELSPLIAARTNAILPDDNYG
jgi:hypothetical protein